MILKGFSEVTAYRMHVPKWSVAPTSGAGAGRHGGRANRIGLNALYLALDVNTAVLEYQPGFSVNASWHARQLSNDD